MKILSFITGLLLSSSTINAASFPDLYIVQDSIDSKHSPYLGFAVHRKNILESLRLNGHFDYKDQRKDDKPQDAVAYLIKRFFPSPAGILQANNINSEKFLKYFTPQGAAYLLNRIDKYRQCLKGFTKEIQQNPGKHSKERIQQKLKQFRDGFLKKIGQGYHPSSSAKQNYCVFQGEVDTDFRKQLALAIEETSLTATQKRSEPNSIYPENIVEQMLAAFFLEKTSSSKDLETFITELRRYSLEGGIETSIEKCIPHFVSLQPCNIKTDEALAFAELKIQDAHRPKIGPKYTLEALEKGLKALPQGEYDLNTLPNLINIRHGYDYFRNPLPALVQGGVQSQCYQRVQDQDGNISHQPFKEAYSPCVENSLRDFINLLIFNPETRKFDLSALKKNLKNYYKDPEDYPQALKDLLNFYTQKQNTQEQLNSAFHDWSAVVCDLNNKKILGENAQEVFYGHNGIERNGIPSLQNRCEIAPDIWNILLVLKALLGHKVFQDLEQKIDPTADEQAQESQFEKIIQAVFERILEVFSSDDMRVEFNLPQMSFSQDHGRLEAYPDIQFQVEKSNGDFKFTWHIGSAHAEIQDLKLEKEIDTFDFSPYKKTILENVQKDPDLIPALPFWFDWKKEKEWNEVAQLDPFAALYSLPLNSNEGKVAFLRTLNGLEKLLKNPLVEATLQKVIQDYPLQANLDHERDEFMKVFLPLWKNDETVTKYLSEHQALFLLRGSLTGQLAEKSFGSHVTIEEEFFQKSLLKSHISLFKEKLDDQTVLETLALNAQTIALSPYVSYAPLNNFLAEFPNSWGEMVNFIDVFAANMKNLHPEKRLAALENLEKIIQRFETENRFPELEKMIFQGCNEKVFLVHAFQNGCPYDNQGDLFEKYDKIFSYVIKLWDQNLFKELRVHCDVEEGNPPFLVSIFEDKRLLPMTIKVIIEKFGNLEILNELMKKYYFKDMMKYMKLTGDAEEDGNNENAVQELAKEQTKKLIQDAFLRNGLSGKDLP